MRIIITAIAAFLIIASCGKAPRLAKEEVTNYAKNASSDYQICGGYSEARKPDKDEYRLFSEVADKLEEMTLTPLTVQTQVVAGINYKFYCRLGDSSEEHSSSHCYVTIYKPLPGQGEPRITSIEKLNQ